MEERTRPRFRVRQILFLQVLVTLPFQDRNLTLVFHYRIVLSFTFRLIIKQLPAVYRLELAARCDCQSRGPDQLDEGVFGTVAKIERVFLGY